MIIKSYKNVLVVFLSGDIDQHKVASIRNDIDKAMVENNAINLVFDFSEVDFMDSSGIGMVLSRYKVLNNKNGQLRISGASENTMRLFDMVGMKKIIQIYSTVDECLLSF